MSDATFARPDLTTFARLDELGLEVVGQRLEPARAVLACHVLEPDRWCRRCGCEGVPRDTVVRRLAHEPLGWRPTTLLVTLRRYRCTGCGHVWRQDTTRAAERGRSCRGAVNAVRRLRADYDGALRQVDLLLMPTTPHTAHPMPSPQEASVADCVGQAGATAVKPAQAAFGGYNGYFADPPVFAGKLRITPAGASTLTGASASGSSNDDDCTNGLRGRPSGRRGTLRAVLYYGPAMNRRTETQSVESDADLAAVLAVLADPAWAPRVG